MLRGWRGLAVTVEGPDRLVQQVLAALPPWFEPAGEVIGGAVLSQTGSAVLAELPEDLSLSGPLAEPETYRALSSRLELLLCAHLPDRVGIHAGVVAVDGRAIVLPGTSMAGKTTLTHALVAAGATYLSDEFALLDADGHVWPYPRAWSMRGPMGRIRSVPGDAAAPEGPALPVGLIADLTYEGRWQVRDISAGEAALRLISNALPARLDPGRTLACTAEAARHARALSGTRGDAAAAADALLGLLRRSPG